jgi:cell wall assembly regulator SMI1
MEQTIISRCEDTLQELYLFSDELLFLGDPIRDNRLKELETVIGYELPIDFKYILTKHNSISLGGHEVYGLDENFKAASLENVYHFEHVVVENPMFKEFLPFSPDGAGNHYCLDLSKLEDNKCPVVFWQHDVVYLHKTDVECCNVDFTDWINEVVIGWIWRTIIMTVPLKLKV